MRRRIWERVMGLRLVDDCDGFGRLVGIPVVELSDATEFDGRFARIWHEGVDAAADFGKVKGLPREGDLHFGSKFPLISSHIRSFE